MPRAVVHNLCCVLVGFLTGRAPVVSLHRAGVGAGSNDPAAAQDAVPVSIDSGRPLELHCRIRRGRPPPSRIDWFKDGVPLAANKRTRISQPTATS